MSRFSTPSSALRILAYVILAGLCVFGTIQNQGLAIFFLILGFTGFLLANYHYKDFFSPIGIFFVMWFVPLGLSQFRLNSQQLPFDQLTWIVTLVSAASFILGTSCVALAQDRIQFSSANPQVPRKLNYSRLRVCSSVLLCLALGGYGYEAYHAGAIPLLADENEIVHSYATFAQTYIHYLTVSTITVALCAYLHMVMNPGQHRVWAASLIAISVFILFSLLSRNQVLMIVVGAAAINNYLKPRKLTLKAVGIGVIVFVLLMNLVAVIRYDPHVTPEIADISLPAWAGFLKWPYAYVALNFEKLRLLLNSGYPPTYGALTFLPVLSFTFTKNLFPVPDFVSPLGWFNTTTYLWSLYSDFRLYGVVIIPFVYGAALTWIYYRLRTKRTVTLVLIYSLLLFALIFLFFYNFFAFPLTYILIAEVWLIMRFTGYEALPVQSARNSSFAELLQSRVSMSPAPRTQGTSRARPRASSVQQL